MPFEDEVVRNLINNVSTALTALEVGEVASLRNDVEELKDEFKEANPTWFNTRETHGPWVANVPGRQQIDFVNANTVPSAVSSSRTALCYFAGYLETITSISFSTDDMASTLKLFFAYMIADLKELESNGFLTLNEEVHLLVAINNPISTPITARAHFCVSKSTTDEETVWTVQLINANYRRGCKVVYNETTDAIIQNTSTSQWGGFDTTLSKSRYAAEAKAVGDALATKADNVAMTGATADTDGTMGLVPAPLAGEQNSVLGGDGIWKPIPDEDDALELVVDMGLVEPVTDESGNVLTDENGILFSL